MNGYCINCFSKIDDLAVCPHCGFSKSTYKESDTVLPLFTKLKNRYYVGRTLGVGGFGITYAGYDTLTGTKCAVKEFMPSQIAYRNGLEVYASSTKEEDRFEHCKDNFLVEAKILQTVSEEHAVVKIRDYFSENNTSYLVMELLEGETLGNLIWKNGGKLDVKTATEMLLLVGSALMAVHSKGILHRDISPENIYHTWDNEYKVIDFGASRYFVSEKSQSLSVYLKPGYAPPEQYSSKGNQGPWTDVYGLAATYYYSLTGKCIADTMDRLSGALYVPLKDLVPGFSQKNSDVVDKALALNYKSRYQSIGEFLQALDLSGIIGTSPANSVPQKINVTTETAAGQKKKTSFFKTLFSKKEKSVSYNSSPVNNIPVKPVQPSSRYEIAYFSSGRLVNKYPLIPGSYIITIGRTDENNIVTANVPQISRKHCMVMINNNAGNVNFSVRDISSNGTFINGSRLTYDVNYSVAPGQKVFLTDNTDYFVIVQKGT